MHKKGLLALALIACLTVGSYGTVPASTIDELEQQKSSNEQELSQISTNIDNIEDQKTALMQDISEKDAELVMTLATIDSLNEQIDQKNAEIVQTSADLEVAEQNKAVEYEAMKKRIQYLYENGGNAGWATFLLEENDISELLNQVEYTQQMYGYDRQCLEEYATTVQQVTDLKSEQETEQSELLSMKNEQELNQQQLESMLSDMQATSENYDEQLAQAQSLASQYRQLISDQNVQIEALVEQQRQATEAAAEAAAAQAAAEAAAAAEAQAAQEAAANAAAQAAAAQAAAEAANAAAGSSSGGSSDSGNSGGSSNSGNSGGSSDSGNSGGESYDSGDSGSSSSSGSASGQAIVDYACQFVGNPYVWGGNSLTNGTDCSGFVNLVYAAFGYSVPRQSASLRSAGRAVSYAEAQPGDIICYDGHVAIYMGGGAIVHASDEKSGIKISYNANYKPIVAVRRVVG